MLKNVTLLTTKTKLLFLSFLTLFGCSRQHLTIYTDYLSHKNLASYHVGTPDPLRNNPPIGQRLIISWSLPKKALTQEDLHLEAKIRFRNREEINETFPICKRSGSYYYSLINEDFMEKGGIITYKVDLIGNGEILEEWRHQLWTELIIFDEEQNGNEKK
jgi:hypothetical protein